MTIIFRVKLERLTTDFTPQDTPINFGIPKIRYNIFHLFADSFFIIIQFSFSIPLNHG